MGGRTVCRLLVRDAAGDNESSLLHETVPSWVTEIVIEKTIPKFVKIPFYLLPHPQMVKQDRMKKVIYLLLILCRYLFKLFDSFYFINLCKYQYCFLFWFDQ